MDHGGAAARDRKEATPLGQLVTLLEGLERDGTSVMDLIRGGRSQQPWTLYPGEYGIFDRKTRCQLYYHSHGAAHEAGHIHTVRLFPDRTAHLVAISLAESGWPRALFTVNLWGIGDAPETTENLKRWAGAFRIDERRGNPRVTRFVNLIFRAFLPEIERLQDGKARTLEAYRLAHPDADPYEDRTLEILSEVEIDVRARQALEQAGGTA